MNSDQNNSFQRGETRRQFIKKSSLAAATVAGAGLLPLRISAAENKPSVAIVLEASDALATQPPAQWAAEQLRDALISRGVAAQIQAGLDAAPPAQTCILAAGRVSPAARQLLDAAKISLPDTPEALALVSGKIGQRVVTLAAGSDVRGLVYALLELADRVNFSNDPLAALKLVKPVSEQPANAIRSVSRGFNSDVEDKPWYQDRNFWPPTSRCWRRTGSTASILHSASATILPPALRDTYFYFAYPFLVSVPGYDVRAVPLPDAERDLNLDHAEIHQRRSGAARPAIPARPLDACLPMDGQSAGELHHQRPHAGNTQAPYCREALRLLLTQCPNITGVTLRTHGESGVPEGDTAIWKTIFDGVAQCGGAGGN